ncbi:LptF/LptG family permease [Candidatus Pelagibacter communis]|uniref:LptF/LptG family permease n=1 Tax=Pelagibacter ubique TaxID=198252 RepID=UPI00094CD5B9|nr:LptF/LptG family permease [Candidatus Pelagibacter ubique]
MKKILYRKLLLDYMSFFLIALISSSTIIWVFQAVNFLDIMIEDGRDYMVYINYSLLNFPKILSKLYPFVLFFSLFYVLSKYELNNELIIFWNFGVDKFQFVNFILKVSLFLFFIQIIFTSFVVPKSQNVARSFLRDSNVNFLGNFIKPKKFNDTIKGVTIYSEKKDENGYLYNLFIKKDISRENFEITYAKKGIFTQANSNPLLILFDGETISNKNRKITNFSFSKSDFLLGNLKSNTITVKKTQELSTLDILQCIVHLYKIDFDLLKNKNLQINNCREKNLINILKEFYKRLIIPIYIPILMLIPYFLILSSKENSNYSKLKLLTFLTGVMTIIFSETTIRFISFELIKNSLLLVSPFLIFVFLYLLFFFKLTFKFKKI